MSDDQRPRGESSDAGSADAESQDQGAFIGSQPEFAADSIVDGPHPDDERVAGEATQSTGPANRGANPDDGWRGAPEGHREGRSADDDLLRRKG